MSNEIERVRPITHRLRIHTMKRLLFVLLLAGCDTETEPLSRDEGIQGIERMCWYGHYGNDSFVHRVPVNQSCPPQMSRWAGVSFKP